MLVDANKQGQYVTRLSGATLYKRLVKAQAKLDIPHLRLHDLRHYNASIMLALGIPDKYAMEIMGHATNNMLKTVYQHTMDSKNDEIAQTLSDFFSN